MCRYAQRYCCIVSDMLKTKGLQKVLKYSRHLWAEN
jgi:hypothetical protein